MNPQAPGKISWIDLTIPNAEAVRDFYAGVVGWVPSPVEMGGYSDFAMVPPQSDDPVAGVCHARGINADIPAQWIIYINVANLEASLKQCEVLGGKIVVSPRILGQGIFAVVQDPSGAVAGLYEHRTIV